MLLCGDIERCGDIDLTVYLLDVWDLSTSYWTCVIHTSDGGVALTLFLMVICITLGLMT